MKLPGRIRIPLIAAAVAVSLSLVLAATLQNPSAYRYLNVFQEVWTLTRSNYVEPVDESALLEGAFRGMAASLDGASAYLAPGEEKLLATPPGPGRPGFETLPTGGGPVIVRVDPGSPAAKAGLEVGDQVWKIAGKSARQQAWPQAKRRLSGPIGGKLDLTILDGRTFKLRDVKLDLEAPQGPGYLLEQRDGPTIYVRLLDLGEIDAAALSRDLSQKIDHQHAAPVLIDLRGTVGLDPASLARVAGAFVTPGPVLLLVPKSGADETVTVAEAHPVAFKAPVYVLVDGTTAGVGEALAAVLRERVGAVVCGRSTYGLGGTPEIVPLPHGGSVLLTTREFRTVGGLRWSEKGLDPDKVLTPQPNRLASSDDKRDTLLEDAMRFVQEKSGNS